MRTPFFALSFLFAFFLFGTPSTLLAMDFHVTTADEFQAALGTAGGNGGDDTILLVLGTYLGNFRFVSIEDRALLLPSTLCK